jgi:lysine-specific demethylase/histidyl-hydroxylase NO66
MIFRVTCHMIRRKTRTRHVINHVTRQVDVTSYRDGVRRTHNGEGAAEAGRVWSMHRQGCSVRLLRPQVREMGTWSLFSGLR